MNNVVYRLVWDTEGFPVSGGRCDPGMCTNLMYKLLAEDPVKVAIVGAGCSTESEATAQASHLWNLTQISYGSSSPILSNRKRFPRFFRLAPPDTTLNPARITLLKYYNWKRVATIHQALEFFSAVTEDFLEKIRNTDIDVVTSEIFYDNPMSQLENMKKHDVRIIFAGCYADMAVRILCQAYKMGLYGHKIVWIFPGWYATHWWQTENQDGCSREQMDRAADGHLVTGHFYLNPKQKRGIAGLTPRRVCSSFPKEAALDNVHALRLCSRTMLRRHLDSGTGSQ
ncbi:hypothetical protein ScPMuIL_012110 [Solemya velum]